MRTFNGTVTARKLSRKYNSSCTPMCSILRFDMDFDFELLKLTGLL